MAQWKQAGLATQRKVVQVELGASLFDGGNVRLDYVRLGGRDWGGAASFFSSFFLNIIKEKIFWIYV